MLPRYGGCHNTNVPFNNFSFSLRKKFSTDTLVNDSLPSKKMYFSWYVLLREKCHRKVPPKENCPEKPKGRMVPFKKFKLYLRLNMMGCIINLEKLAWQLRKIAYCEMLLIQASETNSEPSQVYKMGILAKIDNGFKLILKLIWWGGRGNTRTLRVCLFKHLDQWYEWSNWSEKWKAIRFEYLDHDPLDTG